MDIRLCSILFMNVRLGSILLMDVGLGSGVEVGIGHRGVIGASIDSGIDGSRGSCCWKGSIACRVARVGSVGTSVGGGEDELGTGQSQASKGGDKGLHVDF